MITNITETLEEMKIIYDWSETTYKMYKRILQNYTNFTGLSFEELIEEAETDETNINKVNKRKIKRRLIQYQLHLQKLDKKPNTIIKYRSTIQKVYRHCDIELPELPTIKNTIKENYEDIPTKAEIKKAILHSRIKMKAIITFIASSGLRRSDVSAMTVGDFFKATHDYHQAHDVTSMIIQLERRKIIIPEWHIETVKNGIRHITFSSHESSMYILQMLKERLLKEEITLNDSLFQIRPQGISRNFTRINNKLGFGWKQTRRRFHPHALRKFFATTLTSNDMDYLATEFLLGHTLDSVQQSYYYANPAKLKNKYARYMQYLTFTLEVNYVDISSNEKRELEELRAYRMQSDERIRKLEEMINMI